MRSVRRSPTRAQPMMLYLIKQLEEALYTALEDILYDAEVNPTQYTALTVLEFTPGLTARQLARAAFVSNSRADRLVTGLIALDVVHEQIDDERSSLHLTPAGRGILDRYRVRISDLERRMLSEFSGADIAQLRGYLLECRVAL